jgi:hypothetical protein
MLLHAEGIQQILGLKSVMCHVNTQIRHTALQCMDLLLASTAEGPPALAAALRAEEAAPFLAAAAKALLAAADAESQVCMYLHSRRMQFPCMPWTTLPMQSPHLSRGC